MDKEVTKIFIFDFYFLIMFKYETKQKCIR